MYFTTTIDPTDSGDWLNDILRVGDRIYGYVQGPPAGYHYEGGVLVPNIAGYTNSIGFWLIAAVVLFMLVRR